MVGVGGDDGNSTRASDGDPRLLSLFGDVISMPCTSLPGLPGVVNDVLVD
jgi:hypothetical protein